MTAMFFLMYLNSYQILDHAWFSETRLFMTMIMGGAMIIVMLAFMLAGSQSERGRDQTNAGLCPHTGMIGKCAGETTASRCVSTFFAQWRPDR